MQTDADESKVQEVDKTCSICSGDFKASEFLIHPVCKHGSCKDCLKKHIESKLDEGNAEIKCMMSC